MERKSVLVFAGPSLKMETKLKYPQYEFRPPALQGDIANAVEFSTHTHLIIIDGFYKSVPSIWHKEIIYAIENGKMVIGAGSLGAIRAAELSCYGMLGRGKVYNWYKEGKITRDPDVAVGHGSAEEDYRCFTIPIVNIKSTLEQSGNSYTSSDIESTLNIARSIFFERRTMRSLCKKIESSNIATKKKMLVDLNNHYIDQKQEDCDEVLEWVTTNDLSSPERKEQVNWTIYWNTMLTNDTYTGAQETGMDNTKQAALAFQLINNPRAYVQMRDQSKVIDYRCWLANVMGITVNEDEIREVKDIAIANLISNETSLSSTLSERGLSERAFEDYIKRVAISQKIANNVERGNLNIMHNATHYALLMLNEEAGSIRNGLNNLIKALKDGLYSERDEIPQGDLIPQEIKIILEQEVNSRLGTNKTTNFERTTGLPLSYFKKFAEKYDFYVKHLESLLKGLVDRSKGNNK
jgi:hypothetical protein